MEFSSVFGLQEEKSFTARLQINTKDCKKQGITKMRTKIMQYL